MLLKDQLPPFAVQIVLLIASAPSAIFLFRFSVPAPLEYVVVYVEMTDTTPIVNASFSDKLSGTLVDPIFIFTASSLVLPEAPPILRS